MAGAEVDLVELASAPESLRRRVKEEGELLYDRGGSARP